MLRVELLVEVLGEGIDKAIIKQGEVRDIRPIESLVLARYQEAQLVPTRSGHHKHQPKSLSCFLVELITGRFERKERLLTFSGG